MFKKAEARYKEGDRMRQCTYLKRDGTQCMAIAVKELEPPRCIYHIEKSDRATRVYTPAWDYRKRIRALKMQLSSLCRIKDVVTRFRLTLDGLAMLNTLEDKLKEAERPKILTYAEKLKELEKKT